MEGSEERGRKGGKKRGVWDGGRERGREGGGIMKLKGEQNRRRKSVFFYFHLANLD